MLNTISAVSLAFVHHKKMALNVQLLIWTKFAVPVSSVTKTTYVELLCLLANLVMPQLVLLLLLFAA